jgi:hypothetical protein
VWPSGAVLLLFSKKVTQRSSVPLCSRIFKSGRAPWKWRLIYDRQRKSKKLANFMLVATDLLLWRVMNREDVFFIVQIESTYHGLLEILNG